MDPSVTFEVRAWTSLDRDTLYALLQLRQAVFIVEQDCAYLDADGLDERAVHVIGWRDEALVACARLFAPGVVRDEATIGRVVTAARIRGQGLGRPLMKAAMAEAWRRFGDGPLFVSAQAHLQRYYASLGFVVCGDGYDEDGIPHLPMRHPGAR